MHGFMYVDAGWVVPQAFLQVDVDYIAGLDASAVVMNKIATHLPTKRVIKNRMVI